MSLTIVQSPSTNTPAYNDINYVVQESASGTYLSPNFKFIADVYNGSTRLARLKAPIYPNSTNKGVFNIGRLIENYVSYDWNVNDTTASGCPNSVFFHTVKFGYEYSTGVNSEIISATGLANATGMGAYNMALNPIDFVNFNQNDWLNTSTAAKFLTSNRNKRIYIDQKDWIYFWKGDATAVVITYYPSGTGSPILLTGITDGVIRIPIVSIPANTTYLTIKTQNGTSQKSELYRIDIKTDCSKYENNDIYFLNRYGAVESFRFNKVKRQKYQVKRSQFKQTPYNLVGSNYSYDVSSKSTSNYHTEMDEVITLNSDWITENESLWLKELIASPYIWLMDNGVLKAVNIVNSDYEVKKHINDKVFNLTIEVQTSFTDKVQRL